MALIGIPSWLFWTLISVSAMSLTIVLVLALGFKDILRPFIQAKIKKKAGKHIQGIITKNNRLTFEVGEYVGGAFITDKGIWFINKTLNAPCGLSFALATEDSAFSIGQDELKAFSELRKSGIQSWEDVLNYTGSFKKNIMAIRDDEKLSPESKKEMEERVFKSYDSNILSAASSLETYFNSYANPATYTASLEAAKAEIMKQANDSYTNVMKWIVPVVILFFGGAIAFYIISLGGNSASVANAPTLQTGGGGMIANVGSKVLGTG